MEDAMETHKSRYLACLRGRIREGFLKEEAPEMPRHPGCGQAFERHRSLRHWGSSGCCNAPQENRKGK